MNMQRHLSNQLTSLLLFTRRNSRRITVLTLTAGGALALYNYFKQQLNTVNFALEAERIAGARSLRAVFISNLDTVRTAYLALLLQIGQVFNDCDVVDCSSTLAKLRERPQLPEKTLLWEKLKLGSVTHLVAALYITSAVYATVSMQINLLARYNSHYADAPVQNLPDGQLSSETSRKFLGVCSRAINSLNIHELAKQAERVVKDNLDDIKLTKLYDARKVQLILAKCITSLHDNGKVLSFSRLPEDWVRTELRSYRATGADESQKDRNYEWLLQESLDLCECLDISQVIESYCSTALRHICEQLRTEVKDLSSEGRPFAYMLARFEKIGKELLQGEVEEDLKNNEMGIQFAACVFLSGEKEGRQRDPNFDINRSENNEAQGGDVGGIDGSDVSQEGGLNFLFDVGR